jgi:NADH dehydrogenase subunit B (EC 1.6.5.3)
MGIEEKAGNLGIVTTTLETVVNWGRTNAMWPLLFGLAMLPYRDENGGPGEACMLQVDL